MNTLLNFPNRITQLQTQTVQLIDDQTAAAHEFGVPKPPDSIAAVRARLAAQEYNVLVVGEAKRGKSTFVNALIGASVLPTDLDIATSQVFRVRKASKEDYRLRFEDGRTQPITREDLPHYGSQVVADRGEMLHLEEIIRWIEVDVPAQFLPDGIQLLDTPGLGSLYAQHSIITKRFIREADAVIYVLDSMQPIGEKDIEYIQSIVDVTTDILFIQTRIDQVGKPQWQEMQQRNIAILQSTFDGTLRDYEVWPISSTLLMKAAETGDEDYLIASQHSKLGAALQVFLYQVAGWSKVVAALMLCEEVHQTGQAILKQRLTALTEQSHQQRAAVQQQLAQQQRAFEQFWGERGTERQRLFNRMRNAVQIGRQSMQQYLHPGSPVEMRARERISQITTMEEARERANYQEGEVVAAIFDHWDNVQREMTYEWTAAFRPFMQATNALIVASDVNGIDIYPGTSLPAIDTPGFGDRIRGVAREILPLTGVATLVTGIVAAPLAPVVAAIGAVWGIIRYSRNPDTGTVEKAKHQLRDHLQQTLTKMRSHFLHHSVGSGFHKSLVDEYFDTVMRTTEDHMQRITDQKLAEIQAERERLQAAAQQDEEQRMCQAETLRQQIEKWNTFTITIRRLYKEVEELEQIVSGK
jgi:GTPase SAR1 family protein